MTSPLYILADDLAGAHDVAVPFTKRDFAVAVLSDPDRLDRFDSADLVVLNTNTRSRGADEATNRVSAACEAIRTRSGTIIYKKIDSTLRGHVGLEIDLVCRLMDFDLAVCAPAFPELGRTTVGGYQLLDGVPVRGEDMAGPDIPPEHAFIPDLLARGSRRETVHLDLKTVYAGSVAIRQAVAGTRHAEGVVVVADLTDPQSWNSLLGAVLADREEPADTQSPVPWKVSTLLCGSGGMAGALAEKLAAARKPQPTLYRKPQGSSSIPRGNGTPVLVFACSLHDATTRQVEELAGLKSTTICSFDPLAIIDRQFRRVEVERLTSRVVEAMTEGRNAVVTPERPGQTELQAWFKQLKKAAGSRDPASIVIETLGDVARRLAASVDPVGLVLTGGETAESVFHELDCDGAWMLEYLDRGVGLAAIAGGPHDGLGVVIKPGSFGDPRTLVKAMDRLLARTSDAWNDRSGSSGHRKRDGKDVRPVIGITMGDPNGVGPEIIAKSLAQPWVYDLCRPLVIGHGEVLRRALPLSRTDASVDHDGDRSGTGLDIHLIDSPDSGLYRHGTVDVLNALDLDIDGLVPGKVQSDAGRLAVESVKLAARLAMYGDIEAVATAPMNKEAMGLAGYAYAGHTELLAEITGTKKYRLALAFDGMLVSHATTHVSLRDAIDRLSEEEILDTVDLVGGALAGMGVASPRIAVCGLNPHAGEGGLFGDEEIRIIAPALEKARRRDWNTIGPLPPDTVFMRARTGEFDGIIGMYHDQGHIPVKAIAFDRTVNVTLGLPIIRTSVDHGTAFDIAGKGVADAANLGEALRMAVQLVGDRWSVGSTPGEKAI